MKRLEVKAGEEFELIVKVDNIEVAKQIYSFDESTTITYEGDHGVFGKMEIVPTFIRALKIRRL